jgi:hypothetical protein
MMAVEVEVRVRSGRERESESESRTRTSIFLAFSHPFTHFSLHIGGIVAHH